MQECTNKERIKHYRLVDRMTKDAVKDGEEYHIKSVEHLRILYNCLEAVMEETLLQLFILLKHNNIL